MPRTRVRDDGYTDACGSCNADCSAAGSSPICGDGSLCPELEFCDDGNTASRDKQGDCSAPIMSAVTQFSSVQSRATTVMQLMTPVIQHRQREGSCGDGIIQPLFEVCDDGFADMW